MVYAQCTFFCIKLVISIDKYYIDYYSVVKSFDLGLQKSLQQRCQMKLRAGRQTESKIPPNLSFHRQIFKNKGF